MRTAPSPASCRPNAWPIPDLTPQRPVHFAIQSDRVRLVNTIARLAQRAAAIPFGSRHDDAKSLRDRAYDALKTAIADTNIYDPNQELRLDARQLSMALGISRTPIHEALALLEQEGFV